MLWPIMSPGSQPGRGLGRWSPGDLKSSRGCPPAGGDGEWLWGLKSD